MTRSVSVLLGPLRGVWVLISVFAFFAAVRNDPSTPAGNEFLEALWVVLSLSGIPLTFLTAYTTGGGGWLWLMRVIVASLFGVMIASFIAASGVGYHDSRNSGLLGAPFYSLAIGVCLLVPGAVITGIVLLWRRRKAGMAV